jgi:hypothetical protein
MELKADGHRFLALALGVFQLGSRSQEGPLVRKDPLHPSPFSKQFHCFSSIILSERRSRSQQAAFDGQKREQIKCSHCLSERCAIPRDQGRLSQLLHHRKPKRHSISGAFFIILHLLEDNMGFKRHLFSTVRSLFWPLIDRDIHTESLKQSQHGR